MAEEISIEKEMFHLVQLLQKECNNDLEQNNAMFNIKSSPREKMTEYIDFIRISIKNLLLDIEASRREIQELHRMLEEDGEVGV